MRGPSPSTVLLVVIASVVLTAFHFADNYFAYDSYPPSELVTPALVLVAWPLLTAFGVAGYLLYRRGRFTGAQLCLLVYS